MKTSIRLISAALFLCILLSAFTACGGGTTPAQTTAQGQTAPAQTEPEETGPIRYEATYLPDKNYDGYNYRITDYEEYPLDTDEQSGNVINDAIYERNMLAEEKFKIKITHTSYPYSKYTDVGNLLLNSGRAQSDDGDLYYVVFANAYKGILEGAVPPASALPCIDMTQPWYFQALNKSLNVDGVALLAYNAFDKNPGGKGLVFNQRIISDIGLDSPYKLVDAGTWTYDRFYEYITKGGSDLDGDGQTGDADRYGFITSTDDYTDFIYYGAGMKLMDFSSGKPVINRDEKLFDMYQKAVRYLDENYTILDVFKAWGQKTESQTKGVQQFIGGHGMFIMAYTSTLIQLGDMEDDYGIVPYPKWTETQSQYYAGMDGSRIAVPCTASSDLERVSIVKEYLAVESLNVNYPAYYEISLKNRYVRDEDSVQMLEIITNAMTYDMGAALDYTAVRGPWMDCISSHSDAFASAVASNLPRAEQVIETLNENIAKLKELYGWK